jgi:apolipoprotein N-acyltransferase
MGTPPVPRASVARTLAAVGLAGMAYCHIKDVGMKFDEHVYYMATLFCCNIALSVALIPTVLSASRLPLRLRGYVWAGASALAATTIVGFLWSRTIGFPQMADHIGDWDTLGLSSVGFEMLVVAVSAWMLAEIPHRRSMSRSASMPGAQ